MKNFNLKFQLPKRKKHWKKEETAIKPDYYWRIVINVAFLLVILFSIFGFYNFRKITQETIEGAPAATNPIKNERIMRVLEYFTLREQKSEQIILLPPGISDPSL